MIDVNRYKDIVMQARSMMFKSADIYKGVVYHGNLIIITNYGIMYSMNISDRVPLEYKATIYDRLSVSNFLQYGFDREIFREVMDRYHRTIPNPSQEPIYYDPDFQMNQVFETMRNSTVGAGSFKFILDSYNNYPLVFLLYKGIFNMNKGDNVTMQAYDISYQSNQPEGYIILYNFMICRKKLKKNIHIGFISMNLARAQIRSVV